MIVTRAGDHRGSLKQSSTRSIRKRPAMEEYVFSSGRCRSGLLEWEEEVVNAGPDAAETGRPERPQIGSLYRRTLSASFAGRHGDFGR